MNYAYSLHGAGAVANSRKLKCSESIPAGTYVTLTQAGGTGVVKGLATSVGATNGGLGVSVDASTYTTTQSSSMVEGVNSVIVDPFAVYRMHAVGSATSGLLKTTTASAAASNGLSVTITTGDPAPNSPSMDEGQIFGISGANGGQSRKVTSVSGTVATVIVPFPNAIAVGDVFIIVPWMPGDIASNNINLTTNVLDADGSVAVGTGADFRPDWVEIDFSSVAAAQANSYVYGWYVNHVFQLAI
jgi:hypothetical protein